jgi:hypothetical protein
MNASDRLWAKYRLGERSKIVDPTTKLPAVRNIFLDDPEISVKAVQARGTVFWQCNVALGVVAQQLAAATQMPVEEVRAEHAPSAGEVPHSRRNIAAAIKVGIVAPMNRCSGCTALSRKRTTARATASPHS